MKRLMQNVLVTGGAGFIGSNFVHTLLEMQSDVNIINLDALTYAGSLENLKGLSDPSRHTFVEGDIRDRSLVERLIRKNQVDTVVHFAAESHVDRSISGPSPFVETNIVGTFCLLEAARTVWMEERIQQPELMRFHHISTDEVYGSLAADDPAFSETTAYAPNSPYAASKAASDHLVRSYGHTYGLPVSITNCSNNYGPYQFPEKLIPLMLMNAMRGLPLPIYGDGAQIRDWLYVRDHCEAILQVLIEGAPGTTYNIGGGNQPTNLEIVHMLCEILDARLPDSDHAPHAGLITYVKDRPGHDRRYAMDTRKLQRELGWTPRETLASGLRKTVDWYMGHGEWLAAIQGRLDYAQWMQQNYETREEAQ